jgi:hypothetical protein
MTRNQAQCSVLLLFHKIATWKYINAAAPSKDILSLLKQKLNEVLAIRSRRWNWRTAAGIRMNHPDSTVAFQINWNVERAALISLQVKQMSLSNMKCDDHQARADPP